MYSSTFGKGWVGMSACPLVVLACESLHVCTVCIWRCEHARFCVEVLYALYINFRSFIHSSSSNDSDSYQSQARAGGRSLLTQPCVYIVIYTHPRPPTTPVSLKYMQEILVFWLSHASSYLHLSSPFSSTDSDF